MLPNDYYNLSNTTADLIRYILLNAEIDKNVNLKSIELLASKPGFIYLTVRFNIFLK